MIAHTFISLAVEGGRKRQSPYTGFVHDVDPSGADEVFLEQIPTYENFLFVLALLRSRNRENIAEAIALLDKLLYYERDGNFPFYLHDFPYCHHRWHAVNLFPPLYRIMKHFHRILGKGLKERTKQVADHLLRYFLKELDKGVVEEYLTMLGIGCAGKAFAPLIDEPKIEAEGESCLRSLIARGPQSCWFGSSQMATIFSFLQMAYANLEGGPWRDFWDHLGRTWHPRLHCYCGPAVDEKQWGYDLQPSLVDLYMARHVPRQASDPSHLQAALLFSGKNHLLPQQGSREGKIEGHRWITEIATDYAYSLIEKSPRLTLAENRGFHLFRLIWGDCHRRFSLVCQGGNILSHRFTTKERQIELWLTLGKERETYEVSLYLSAHSDVTVTVDRVSATTFHINQEVVIHSSLSITLSFAIEEGEGQMVGHLMPGNRPAQVQTRCEKPFDRQILLRTLRRSQECTVRVSLTF